MLNERYRALVECVQAATDTICASVKVSAVQAAMWHVLSAFRISACFPHGHGLGVEIRDYPIIVADNGLRILDDCVDVPSDIPLEEDMVINLEAAIFMPGTASLHIEQTFVVTTTGCRPLIEQQRTMPYIPVELTEGG
jgi:Xaa-Pro aminopeptidase